MTILSWLLALPIILALVAQIAFFVIGISGLASALSNRFSFKFKSKVPAPRT